MLAKRLSVPFSLVFLKKEKIIIIEMSLQASVNLEILSLLFNLEFQYQ